MAISPTIIPAGSAPARRGQNGAGSGRSGRRASDPSRNVAPPEQTRDPVATAGRPGRHTAADPWKFARVLAAFAESGAGLVVHLAERRPDPAWQAIATELDWLAAWLREYAAAGTAWPCKEPATENLVN